VNIESNIPVEITGETATVFATDYLNKLSGEKIASSTQAAKPLSSTLPKPKSSTASAFRFF
jgi:hypothetical protein